MTGPMVEQVGNMLMLRAETWDGYGCLVKVSRIIGFYGQKDGKCCIFVDGGPKAYVLDRSAEEVAEEVENAAQRYFPAIDRYDA
jgi:hypothetical protein